MDVQGGKSRIDTGGSVNVQYLSGSEDSRKNSCRISRLWKSLTFKRPHQHLKKTTTTCTLKLHVASSISDSPYSFHNQPLLCCYSSLNPNVHSLNFMESLLLPEIIVEDYWTELKYFLYFVLKKPFKGASHCSLWSQQADLPAYCLRYLIFNACLLFS